MLRRSARDFLAKECTPAVVRRLIEDGDAYDERLWKKIADLGWTGLGIPEEYGGGGGFLELTGVLEESGRNLLPRPFFSTMGLAGPPPLPGGAPHPPKEGGGGGRRRGGAAGPP